jgi:hypothetical protein
MKKLISLLVVVVTIALSTTVYSQVQIFGKLSDNKVTPDLNVFGTKKISEKVNLTYFALVEEKWSEGLLGVSYSPEDFINLGVGVGIESNPALYRLCASVWVGKGNTSLLILGEKGDGPTNYWYKATADYKLSESFSASLIAWRFIGIGPAANISIKKFDSKLWLFPAYDFESKKPSLTLGLDIKI